VLASYVYSQTCGAPSIKPSISRQTKIVNGDAAVPNSWPWLVSLRYGTIASNSHFCGGSLLDSTTVITAAHCVDGLSSVSFFVVVGTNYLDESLVQNVNAFSVKLIRKHLQYNSISITNDIAIIKLTTAVKFSTKVQPICLPTSTSLSVIYNKNVSIAGWGYTSGIKGQEVLSNAVLQAKLTVITDSIKCQGLQTKNYCAIDKTSKQSNTCQGDSGGPLMYFMNNKYFLYGLVSFGFENTDGSNTCINTLPSFYTRIPSYLSWISTNRK